MIDCRNCYKHSFLLTLMINYDYFSEDRPDGIYILYRLDTPENVEKTQRLFSQLEELGFDVRLVDSMKNPDGPEL